MRMPWCLATKRDAGLAVSPQRLTAFDVPMRAAASTAVLGANLTTVISLFGCRSMPPTSSMERHPHTKGSLSLKDLERDQSENLKDSDLVIGNTSSIAVDMV